MSFWFDVWSGNHESDALALAKGTWVENGGYEIAYDDPDRLTAHVVRSEFAPKLVRVGRVLSTAEAEGVRCANYNDFLCHFVKTRQKVKDGVVTNVAGDVLVFLRSDEPHDHYPVAGECGLCGRSLSTLTTAAKTVKDCFTALHDRVCEANELLGRPGASTLRIAEAVREVFAEHERKIAAADAVLQRHKKLLSFWRGQNMRQSVIILKLAGAIEAIKGISADREAFVFQGPRGFAAAERVAEVAISEYEAYLRTNNDIAISALPDEMLPVPVEWHAWLISALQQEGAQKPPGDPVRVALFALAARVESLGPDAFDWPEPPVQKESP